MPIELSGVTMTINGVACGLKYVSRHEITFVVPRGLLGSESGTILPFVINNNGFVSKGEVTIVFSRPDVFTTLPVPGAFGRADVRNVTNRVHTTEPFTVTTIKIKGGRRVPSLLRLRATGIMDLAAGNLTIRIGSVTMSGSQIKTAAIQVEPGIFEVDFEVSPLLNLANDQPLVLFGFVGQTQYFSRLDDTAPMIRFL